MLLNLLSNAIKFTPEAGRVGVRAEPVDEYVEVAISDTGIGIAPEDHEAVFEEFRQVGAAEKRAEGTGLGLAFSPEVHRAAWWENLGEVPGGGGLDLHVHASGADWRMRGM